MEVDRKLIDKITKRLVDDGKLIEAGWIALKMLSIPSTAPQIQIDEMRGSFFAGAQHLLASILSILEPGVEPTEKDLERMDLIQKELNEFTERYKAGMQ